MPKPCFPFILFMTHSRTIGSSVTSSITFHSIQGDEKELTSTLTVTLLDDYSLIQRMDQGDEDALGELYERYGRLVFSVAYGVVQNQETAEEVTLDIFSRAWEKADIYDPQKGKVSTWLTRMARNLAIDRLRWEKIRPEKDSIYWAELPTEPITDSDDPEFQAGLRQQQTKVRQAIAALPESQQTALALAYFKGMSHRDIAAYLDEPLGTIKGRIRAGMKSLKITLSDR
jgi:RNA polymerase sigma-70 factor (ECF subfamily)